MRQRFLPNTATWSTALALACALPGCSSDSKSDTARATETDDNSSSDDDSPSDTPEAGTSAGDDDGARESDESDDSSNAANEDDAADDSDDATPNGSNSSDDEDPAQSDDPAGDGSSADDSHDSSGADDGNATSDDDGSETVCTQGDTRECVGVGACSGGQICGADGFWEACECGTVTGEDTVTSGPSNDGASSGDRNPDEEDTDDDNASSDSTTDEETLSVPSDAPTGPIDLGSGFALSEPLVVPPWDQAFSESVRITLEDLDLIFTAGFGFGLQHGNHARDVARPYDAPGRYCPSGEGVAIELYLGDAPGISFSFLDAGGDGVWPSSERGVVGVQFEISGAPETGVIFAFSDPNREWQGRQPFWNGTHTVIFGNRNSDGSVSVPVSLDESVAAVYPIDGNPSAIHFLVHDSSVMDELSPYDYCVSNIRFIVEYQ